MKPGLTLKIFFLIVLTDIGESFGQLFMKKGLDQTGIQITNLASLPDFLYATAVSPYVWLGIVLFALTFFIWIVVLCHVDLSTAMPMGSTSFILTPILAWIFLHEHIGVLRWLGIFLIIVGIYLVSKSSQHQSMPQVKHA